ncbi:pseudouridine synthase [Marinicella pacifica]|uniref:Pseudouridine synthase n=1 Tax=Marinicella pacifica TaxID=1171543 RepID=A0A917FTG6_9GAMM|nr:RluA family pseudouridine synthase [Marinicella pacifica]GGG00305.1 pseudouridine synthase [Marinicella pacifica]
MDKPIFNIDRHSEGQRLDNFLRKQRKNLTTGQLYKLIRKGQIRINGKRSQPSAKLQNGDLVRVPPFIYFEEPQTQIKLPAKTVDCLMASIIAENQDYLVINKPAGMAVHKGTGHDYGVIEILQHRPAYQHLLLAHRLDVVTSGCLVLAKNRTALLDFQAALKARKVKKTYLALLEGALDNSVLVKQSLAETRINNLKTAVIDDKGKTAVTQFEPQGHRNGISRVLCSPVTGRTHQIRAHAAYLNCPIVGDTQYGAKPRKNLSRAVFLHAEHIVFADYSFQAPVDADFENFWQSL